MYLSPQPNIQFNSSGSQGLANFRIYYKSVFDGPGPTPIPEPFAYTDTYFVVAAYPSVPSEQTQTDYVAQMQVEVLGFQGQMRVSVVEVDQAGNMSDFSSPELIVTIDLVAPVGVSDLQLAQPVGNTN